MLSMENIYTIVCFPVCGKTIILGFCLYGCTNKLKRSSYLDCLFVVDIFRNLNFCFRAVSQKGQ